MMSPLLDRVHPVVIVGSGIAGLAAARVLAENGLQPLVVDKGRRPGGRMASRKLGDALADHGAQYFTARNQQFTRLVTDWLAGGSCAVWARGFPTADGHDRVGNGYPRYRGADSMNGIPAQLATNLAVHQETRVTAITAHNHRWEITVESGELVGADRLILTPPVPQALALLEAGKVGLEPPVAEALARISYAPCFALLVALDRPSRVPSPGGLHGDGEPIAWLADNQQKGVSKQPVVTIHAGPGFSTARFDDDPTRITEELLEAAERWIGNAVVTETYLHRWRYSQALIQHPGPYLAADRPAPLVFAGDAFGAARIEGAYLSGLAAGEALLARIGS